MLAPVEGGILRLGIPNVGILHLQPAGDDAFDPQPLDRDRVRWRQFGPEQLQLAGEEIADGECGATASRRQATSAPRSAFRITPACSSRARVTSAA
jgi:hypothetical protein